MSIPIPITPISVSASASASAFGVDHDADVDTYSDPLAAFTIAVMAKAPIAGLAKTRLIPLLGPVGAARAQREFALRTLATAQAARPGSLVLSCAPDRNQRFFQALHRSARWPTVRFTSQSPGDIGERMAAVFAEHAMHTATQARGSKEMQQPTATDSLRRRGEQAERPASVPAPRPAPEPLLLIGTDCPVLTPGYLQAAADALRHGADVVFGPVEDGGYMLVGLREPAAAAKLGLFAGIDWSTERVLAQSRERLRTAHARWHELSLLWDVDEPADWLRWQRVRQRAQPPDVSPASADRSQPASPP